MAYRLDVRPLRGIVCFLNEVGRRGLVNRCSGNQDQKFVIC